MCCKLPHMMRLENVPPKLETVMMSHFRIVKTSNSKFPHFRTSRNQPKWTHQKTHLQKCTFDKCNATCIRSWYHGARKWKKHKKLQKVTYLTRFGQSRPASAVFYHIGRHPPFGDLFARSSLTSHFLTFEGATMGARGCRIWWFRLMQKLQNACV